MHEEGGELLGLDQAQHACRSFAQALVRMEQAQVPQQDERYQFVQQLLQHAIARKRDMVSHYPPGVVVPSEKRSMLSQDQRVQLITQIHAVKFLIQRSDEIRHGRMPQPFPIVVQHSIGAFNFAIQLREGKIKNLNANQKAQIQAALNTATRLASRVIDPSTLLIETLGMLYVPQPLRREVVLNERERLMDMQAREKIVQLEQLGEKTRAQEIELKSLKLRSLQKRVRDKVNESVSWDEIVAGGFHGSREEIMALREAKRRKKEQQIRRAELKGWTNHSNSFFKHFREMRAKIQTVSKSVLDSLKSKANRLVEQDRVAQKMRLAALKEQNEEAYFKLIKDAKDERLHFILAETDKYLVQLAKSIVQHKHDNQESVDELENHIKESEETPEDADYSKGRKLYDAITHTLQSDVSEQPKLLKGGVLKDFQLDGLKWLVSLYQNNLNGILADEMGLGKTVQTIALFAYLMENLSVKGPFLVVAPMSTLRNNWAKELEKWLPNAIVMVYEGDKDRRRNIRGANLQSQRFNVLLTTYDFLMRDKRYLANIEWEHIVVDEAHRLKNEKSKLSIILNQHYKSKRRLALTGTPLQNNLQELWALLNFLHPEVFDSSSDFDKWFSGPLYNSGISNSDQSAELSEEQQLLVINRLHTVLRPFMLRRLKKDVISRLPTKSERIIVCPTSDLQGFMYNCIASNEVALNSRSMQYRKVCNHPFLFHPFFQGTAELSFPIDDNLIRSSGKMLMLDTILPKLQASGHRVLMFFQMTKMMDIMEMYLEYRGYSFLRLDGSTKRDDRVNRLQQFNEGEDQVFVFMLSTKAGGVGLNLQTADTVILFDSDWNPQNDLQAQARAHRIGQTQDVLVLRLVTANTVEEQIMESAGAKLDTEAVIIRAGMFTSQYQSEESRRMLESLLSERKEMESIEDGNLEEDVDADFNEDELSTKEQMNISLARTDDEIALFDSIDSKAEASSLSLSKIEETPVWVIHWWEMNTKRKFDLSRLAPGQTISIKAEPEPYESADVNDLSEQMDVDQERTSRSARKAISRNVRFKFTREVSVAVKFEGEVVHSDLQALVPFSVEGTATLKPQEKSAMYKEDSD